MNFIETTSLTDLQERCIHELWNNEYPMVIHHNTLEDTQNYLNKLENPYHVFIDEDGIKAWCCDFDRDGKRYFVMIIDKSVQGKGLGSELLNMAKVRNSELYGWIVLDKEYEMSDGNVYKSPKDFYLKNNFKLHPEIHSPKHILKTVLISWSA